ncbi:MAG: hypothetical protein QGI45_07410 [Myxococcota bacterium]|jgi:hypothetical protein|nr:hypothetical protein [Myxococcota bacterium]
MQQHFDLENEYTKLFDTVQSLAEYDPEHVPELFTVLLAGAPFRPFLERPELLTKAVVEAKRLIREGDTMLDDVPADNVQSTPERMSVAASLAQQGPSRC